MKQWYVAQTQVQKETFARDELQNQGFDVYLPRYERVRKHARKVDTVLAPLFPRYIFISFDSEIDQWRRINGTRGIAYLLTNNERPASVPEDVIKELRARETKENLVDLSSLALFAKGDEVYIKGGAFEGMSAKFESMNDKQRVQLLLTFLGRETEIQIPLHMLETY